MQSNMAPRKGILKASRAVEVVRNALLHACASQWPWALWLLGPERDVVSYGSVLHAMVRGAAWSLALELYADMRARRLGSNSIVLNTALAACERGSLWQQAVALLSESRLRPDATSFRSLISASPWRKAFMWLTSAASLGLKVTPKAPWQVALRLLGTQAP